MTNTKLSQSQDTFIAFLVDVSFERAFISQETHTFDWSQHLQTLNVIKTHVLIN